MTSKDSYYKTIKAVLMGCGEDDLDSTVMAKILLLDPELTDKEALQLAEAYAESRSNPERLSLDQDT